MSILSFSYGTGMTREVHCKFTVIVGIILSTGEVEDSDSLIHIPSLA
jgi:hypothetical protein